MESIVGVREFSLIEQTEAEIVVRLSIARVWISRCEAAHAAREVLFSLRELSRAEVRQSNCVVDACIVRIALESFAPIRVC